MVKNDRLGLLVHQANHNDHIVKYFLVKGSREGLATGLLSTYMTYIFCVLFYLNVYIALIIFRLLSLDYLMT